MPKEHVESILDCPPVLLSKIMSVAQMLSIEILNKLHAQGINVLTNAKPAAGQSVMHFHVHILPRYDENDGLILKFRGNPSPDLKKIEELLKK
jgi:histidine triad (HIT) family protein